MQFITRPLLTWPRPATTKRTNAGYGVGYEKSLNLLDRELEHLKVTGDVVIQIDMPEGDIRRDGLPYAGKSARTPRVAISFTSKHGPLAYYCDAHHDWRDNVRTIVLGLERLRLVERTGVISRGEQYTGFKALPSGMPMPAATMTVEDAAMMLMHAADVGGLRTSAANILSHPDHFITAYRSAAKKMHPDVGGKRDEWDRLQDAADILKKHHNIS